MKTGSSLFLQCLATAIVSGVIASAALGACTSPAASPSGAGSECMYFNYQHDEAKNAAGPGRCASDCDCNGMRSCKGGACEGEARPKISCNNVDYHWNEAWNTQGPGKCASDCDCDGLRSCKAGACEGEARPTAEEPKTHVMHP